MDKLQGYCCISNITHTWEKFLEGGNVTKDLRSHQEFSVNGHFTLLQYFLKNVFPSFAFYPSHNLVTTEIHWESPELRSDLHGNLLWEYFRLEKWLCGVFRNWPPLRPTRFQTVTSFFSSHLVYVSQSVTLLLILHVLWHTVNFS